MSCFGGLEIRDVHSALQQLLNNPTQLNNDRLRFDGAAPSYISRESHSSTRSQSPCGLSETQKHESHRQRQLDTENEASRPCRQFDAQVKEYEGKIIQAIETRKFLVETEINIRDLARRMVEVDWRDQGIWSEGWVDLPGGRWRHEDSPGSPHQIERSEDAAPNLDHLFVCKPRAGPSAPKHLDDQPKQQLAVPRIRPAYMDEPSRPFPQFVHHISKARRRLQSEIEDKPEDSFPPDINTRAYTLVRDRWIKIGIWDKDWGVIPGLAWKHEGPPCGFAHIYTSDQSNVLQEYDVCDKKNFLSVPDAHLTVGKHRLSGSVHAVKKGSQKAASKRKCATDPSQGRRNHKAARGIFKDIPDPSNKDDQAGRDGIRRSLRLKQQQHRG